MTESYLDVTEIPGNGASKEQLARLFSRYKFALQYCFGKDVLEVACGSGIGLGYLSRVAKSVTGGDIDEDILKVPIKHYKGRNGIEIKKLDAESLPFNNNRFDVVILYEAIYYLAQPTRFIAEACRVLGEGGILIICTVNKDWLDFNPSPFSTKYFSGPELYEILGNEFAKVELYGGFIATSDSLKDWIVSWTKRIAVGFHLIPKTMKGKELLKRIFFGKLAPLPNEIRDGMYEYVPPAPISHISSNSQYKVLYAVASK